MTTVYKYRVPFPSGGLLVPREGRVLALQMQDGEATLWVHVDPDAPAVERRFQFYGTGHRMPDHPGDYVGTVQDGSLVWHLFEAP